MAESEDAEHEIRRAFDVIQSMIDISADRLEGLRTQCSTSAELTQQEIRTLEVIVILKENCKTKRYVLIVFYLLFVQQGKLIKLYSKQLVTKSKLPLELWPPDMRLCPCLRQWLRVVGLSQESIQVCANMQA